MSLCTAVAVYFAMTVVTAVFIVIYPSDEGQPELPTEGILAFSLAWPVILPLLVVSGVIDVVRWYLGRREQTPPDSSRRECSRCLALVPTKARWCPRCRFRFDTQS